MNGARQSGASGLNKPLTGFVRQIERRESDSMKLVLTILALGLTLATGATAGEKPLVYYVQLIRCSDQDQPPEPGSRRVGPKLSERFQCVFRCNSYWEITQQKLDVVPSRVARARLTNGREVEIDLTQAGKRRVSTFHNGRLIDRTIEPAGENMTLIGGDRDQASHWFIVVRRDKPGE